MKNLSTLCVALLGINLSLNATDIAKALSVKLYLDKKTKYTRRVRHAQAKDPTAV